MKFLGYLFALSMLAAQVPRIGQIEFYGLSKHSEARLRKVLQLREGDPLPPSKADLEEKLEKLPGVVQARLEAVCCEDGKAILFVGIEEKGGPHFSLRSAPAGNALLPSNMVEAFHSFLARLESAARKGGEPDPGPFREQFSEFARDSLALLRDVLRNSSDYEHRAMAATIIGYAPEKQKVVDDLEYAMQDPDDAVRANAMQSLTNIALLGLPVSPTWFVEMLNSIVLSDRVKAAAALLNLTENGGQRVRDHIRERALPSLVEMAQWKSLKYALPPYILLGRVAGLPEKEIQASWTSGDRAKVLKAATRKGK